MPRQSPLEEGEHAGDTDDDVMMIDEVDNKGRSSGGRRDIGRGRRSRSRSNKNHATKQNQSNITTTATTT